MEKLDGRKLSRSTLAEIRIRAVKRVESGVSPEDVIKALGFHRSLIYKWLSLYREGGFEALKENKVKGRESKLNGTHLQALYQLITLKNPSQLKFEFALWTRGIVRDVIRDKFKVEVSDVSVGRLLHKLGLSPQKPLRRAYQRDEAKVEAWRTTIYPEIQKHAKKHKAQIYFGGEAGFRSDYHSGTTWAPVGKTPVVKTSGARFGINMISAVSPKGHLRFMTFEGRMNSEKFIEFLKRLTYKIGHPIFLILDGHAVHKSKKVRDYVDTTEGKLKLFILPPYSPHLNPDEWVWNWLKRHNIGKTYITGPDQFKKAAQRFMLRLQKQVEVIKGFFRDPNLNYISATDSVV